MGRKRSHRWAGLCLPDNVVSFEDHWRRRHPTATLPERHTAFYLTERHEWLDTLRTFPSLTVKPIDDSLNLKSALLRQSPDVILIEAGLTWDDPLALIGALSTMTNVPIALIYGSEDIKRVPDLLKHAFCHGVHDTLAAPLRRDAVMETVDVLLKLRRQATLP